MLRCLNAALVAVCLACGLAAAGGPARAAPAILVDAATGEVLYAHRAFDRWHPASITKLMTAYLAFSAIRAGQLAPDSPVQISKNALDNPPSKMGFPVGTRITLSSALKMLIVKSANDIAVAVGETVGGSEPAFVELMNRTAGRLGMNATHFVNPHGLHDPNQYTSARDMAVLARAILHEFPQYEFLFSVPSIKVGKRVLRTHNRLVGRYPGATGMKTGYICSGGYNLVASAKRGGREYIAVVLGAPNGSYRALVAAHLLENGFDGMRGFTSGRYGSIESYRGRGAEPFDMRPYLCKPRSQRPPIPGSIASYGFEVPIAQGDADVEDSEEVDPMSRRGVAAIQVSSRRASSRAERIAALLAGPATGAPVNANGLLPADPLASMTLPRSIPFPPRTVTVATGGNTPAAAQAAAAPAVAASSLANNDAAALLRPSIPLPPRRPER